LCKIFVFNSQALGIDFKDLLNKNARLQTGTNMPDINVRDGAMVLNLPILNTKLITSQLN